VLAVAAALAERGSLDRAEVVALYRVRGAKAARVARLVRQQ
jgi:hypothetical protein